jgi:capsule polysaccharide export protein KpsE/RkpR
MERLPEIADHDEQPVSAELPEADQRLNSISGLRMLWERRRFLWRCTWIGCVGSILIAFLIPNRYTSTVRLMPPEEQPSSSMLGMLSAAAGNSALPLASTLLGIRTSGSLFIGVLRSRVVQDRLIDRFDLRRVYYVKRWVDARKKLDQYTDIGEDRKSGIIIIQVTDRDSQRAAALGRAYVEELNRIVSTLTTSSAHRERVFLEERLKVVKQDLDTASRALGEFSSKNTTIDIRDQGKAMMDAAATLQGQLIADQSQLKGLEQIYSSNNVRVRSLRAHVNELQHQLEEFTGKSNSEAANALYPSIRELPLLGVTYADLYRRAKIEEVVFETLTKQCELAKVQEAKEIPTVQTLDPAEVPERKSFPPRLLIIVTSTLLMFSAGVLMVWVQESWKRTPPEDAARLLVHDVATTLSRRARELASLRRYFPHSRTRNTDVAATEQPPDTAELR